MAQNQYLVQTLEPLGPFQTMAQRREAFEAVGLFAIGYRMNSRYWNRGELVVHVCDTKRADMLMQVIGYTRDGLVKTQYIDPFYENENHDRHNKSISKVWTNEMANLLDPKDFGIEVPV
jgi:hypothetical protein